MIARECDLECVIAGSEVLLRLSDKYRVFPTLATEAESSCARARLESSR